MDLTHKINQNHGFITNIKQNHGFVIKNKQKNVGLLLKINLNHGFITRNKPNKPTVTSGMDQCPLSWEIPSVAEDPELE